MIKKEDDERLESAYCASVALSILNDLVHARASIAEMKAITYKLNQLIEEKAQGNDPVT